jgi:hypothetical protein
VLRFLIASREEVTSSQLRDDLLSMLVAGHETTASVLTWTLYLLTKHPEKMAKVQEEVERELGAKIDANDLKMKDLGGLNYLRWCIFESMRLYPHPPVLIRRALEDDVLPNGWKVPEGQDVMISVYNIHHSKEVWSNPDDFLPERWSKYDSPSDMPNERNTDYHYIPFSGGQRKCVGDRFALLESYTAMSVLLHNFDFKLVNEHDVGMTTGATIHTSNGMMMSYSLRQKKPTQERRVDPMLAGRSVTYDEMVNAYATSELSERQLLEHWISLHPPQAAQAESPFVRDRDVVPQQPAAARASAASAAGAAVVRVDTTMPRTAWHYQRPAALSADPAKKKEEEFKVVDATKYLRTVLGRLQEDAADGAISQAEAEKALRDIAKAPGDFGLKALKFVTDAFGRGASEQATDSMLDAEQKVDAYKSFNPLEKFFFWRFALTVADELPGVDVQPATDFAGLMSHVNQVAMSENQIVIQSKAKRAMVRLFPGFLFPAYRLLFGPFKDFSALMIAYVTQFGSQWLMGPSKLEDLHREDGTVGKDLVLKIEKCRFLEETGPCVRTCLHACKVPTQQFFIEEMGLPVTLKPNMTSLGCEFHFGVPPVPLDQDPVAATPCFATCQVKARHNIDTDPC